MTRFATAAVLFLMGCPASTTSTEPTDVDPTGTPVTPVTPVDGIEVDSTVYRFPGRDDATADSVSYTGQIFRQLLIDDMKAHVDALTTRIDGGFIPATGDVEGELLFFADFDSATSGSLAPLFTTDPALLQATYDDVSSDKNLFGKVAGNDAVGQHKDWSTEFVGWEADGVTSPESLIRFWIGEIDAQAVDWASGTYPLDPDGTPVAAVYITEDGVDLNQLLQKFTRMSIAFSQGADDYLDDDEPGKGLLADHTAVEEGKSYTALEHAWDEGYGYFGGSQAMGGWSLDDVANGIIDDNEDGMIDLTTEVVFGHAKNAAKRDNGAVVATTFTEDSFQAFHSGRALIASADGALTTEQAAELIEHRDNALEAWEKAVAATVVHYINDTLRDMEAMGTDTYSFTDHAKHWSEMKGFALGLQFNRHSPLTDAQFAEVQTQMDVKPVLASATPEELEAYRVDLLAARATLGTAYGFDAANLGDDAGSGGW